MGVCRCVYEVGQEVPGNIPQNNSNGELLGWNSSRRSSQPWHIGPWVRPRIAVINEGARFSGDVALGGVHWAENVPEAIYQYDGSVLLHYTMVITS